MTAGRKAHLQPDIVLKVLDLALPVLRQNRDLDLLCHIGDALGWCGALALAQQDNRPRSVAEVGKYSEAWTNAATARQQMMAGLMDNVGVHAVAAIMNVMAGKVPAKYHDKAQLGAEAGVKAALGVATQKTIDKVKDQLRGGEEKEAEAEDAPPAGTPPPPPIKERLTALVHGLLALDDEVVADTVFRILGLTGRKLSDTHTRSGKLLLRLVIALSKRDAGALVRLLDNEDSVITLFDLLAPRLGMDKGSRGRMLAIIHLLKLSVADGSMTAAARNRLSELETAMKVLKALLRFRRYKPPLATPRTAPTSTGVTEELELLQPTMVKWLAQRLVVSPVQLEALLRLTSRQLGADALVAKDNHIATKDNHIAAMQDNATVQHVLRELHMDGHTDSTCRDIAVSTLVLTSSLVKAHVQGAAKLLAKEFVFHACGQLLQKADIDAMGLLALAGRGYSDGEPLYSVLDGLGVSPPSRHPGVQVARQALREASQRLQRGTTRESPLSPEGIVRTPLCWSNCTCAAGSSPTLPQPRQQPADNLSVTAFGAAEQLLACNTCIPAFVKELVKVRLSAGQANSLLSLSSLALMTSATVEELTMKACVALRLRWLDFIPLIRVACFTRPSDLVLATTRDAAPNSSSEAAAVDASPLHAVARVLDVALEEGQIQDVVRACAGLSSSRGVNAGQNPLEISLDEVFHQFKVVVRDSESGRSDRQVASFLAKAALGVSASDLRAEATKVLPPF